MGCKSHLTEGSQYARHCLSALYALTHLVLLTTYKISSIIIPILDEEAKAQKSLVTSPRSQSKSVAEARQSDPRAQAQNHYISPGAFYMVSTHQLPVD